MATPSSVYAFHKKRCFVLSSCRFTSVYVRHLQYANISEACILILVRSTRIFGHLQLKLQSVKKNQTVCFAFFILYKQYKYSTTSHRTKTFLQAPQLTCGSPCVRVVLVHATMREPPYQGTFRFLLLGLPFLFCCVPDLSRPCLNALSSIS